jgi:hypothetical protein
MIRNTTYTQKQMASSNGNNNSWNIPHLSVPIPYVEQFTRQLNEFTNNTIRVSNINNQFTIIMLDTIRENLNICNKATDAVSKYNTNMAKAWNSFFS